MEKLPKISSICPLKPSGAQSMMCRLIGDFRVHWILRTLVGSHTLNSRLSKLLNEVEVEYIRISQSST